MKKLTLKYIKEYIESFGYKLLSTEYINNYTLLKVQCINNHIYKVTWGNFKTGYRCPYCAFNNKKPSYQYIKDYMESKNYILLSKKYQNNNTKLKIQCSKGHIFKMTWSNFQQGNRCPYCAGRIVTYQQVKEFIESKGYKLLDKEYKGAHKKFKMKCPKGHIYEVTWNNFQRGERCPYCFKQYSRISQELFKAIHRYLPNNLKIYYGELNYEYRVNTKKSYKKLDFYIPSLNKCIEFDGTFWHQNELEDHIREQEIKESIPDIKFLRIKEKNFIRNFEKEIQKCLEFIGVYNEL